MRLIDRHLESLSITTAVAALTAKTLGKQIIWELWVVYLFILGPLKMLSCLKFNIHSSVRR